MKLRTTMLLGGVLVLGAFGWLAVTVRHAATAPEEYLRRGARGAWMLGPPPEVLRRAAESHAQNGLAQLNDSSLPGGERLQRYRQHLEAADALLERSLRTRPSQSRALAQWAAVRWELRPPLDPTASARVLAMVSRASQLAPTAPWSQADLGSLLLRMGRRQDALVYLRRTAELSPAGAERVVRLLREDLAPAEEILASLPTNAAVLAALADAFVEDGSVSRYLDEVEGFLRKRPEALSGALLRSYGDVGLRQHAPDRIAETLTTLGPRDDAAVESERLRQRARAGLALGSAKMALRDARRAVEVQPSDCRLREFLGDTLLELGDPAQALEAFRGALGLAASQSTADEYRGRLYRKVGVADHRLGRVRRAYDAYEMALRLNPGDELARRRLAELQSTEAPR